LAKVWWLPFLGHGVVANRVDFAMRLDNKRWCHSKYLRPAAANCVFVWYTRMWEIVNLSRWNFRSFLTSLKTTVFFGLQSGEKRLIVRHHRWNCIGLPRRDGQTDRQSTTCLLWR